LIINSGFDKVNGICIGLAGKLSVLGRATTLADYILVGQEEVKKED